MNRAYVHSKQVYSLVVIKVTKSYFLSEQYKRYESVFNCELCGFRLLFLTNTLGRLASLCRLAQDMGPDDTCFVWLTDQSRLEDDGVTGRIWAQGGALVLWENIFGKSQPGK